MMKILLINPPIPYRFRMFDYADQEGKEAILRRILIGPPLGLNDIAGMLDDEEVVIMDQKTELDNNPDYDSEEDLIQELKEFKPDIVGFTCITAQYNSLKGLLPLVKKYNKKILTVIGGIHVTSAPCDFENYDADILVLGLGKVTFYKIVQEFKHHFVKADYTHIPGIAINNGKGLYFTEPYGKGDINEFYRDDCIPNRKLTEKYNYIFPKLKKKVHYISTSLGCTHRCNFCFLWKMTAGRYVCRDTDSIINELKTMEEYPIIRFCDANTFGNIRKAEELFRKIIESRIKHFYIADLRVDTVMKHTEIIKLAYEAGLKSTICGLEATSDEELKKYGKGSSVEIIRQALKIMNEVGIYVNGNYIIRPDYGMKDFERVAKFVENNPIFHSGFTILTPFPGTPQWEELKDQIILKDFDYYNLTNAVLKTRLPEEQFYKNISDLYKISAKSTQKYFSLYGESIPGVN